MNKFIYVIVMILSGVICYITAKKRNLGNPWLWFAGGMVAHVVAVALVTFVAKYVAEKKNRGVSS